MAHENLYPNILREVRRIMTVLGIRKNVEMLSPSELLEYYEKIAVKYAEHEAAHENR